MMLHRAVQSLSRCTRIAPHRVVQRRYAVNAQPFLPAAVLPQTRNPVLSTSMLEPYPGLDPSEVQTGKASGTVDVTVLPNGMKVVSQNAPGLVSSIGVSVQCGTRDETARFRSATMMLEKLSFKSTEKYSASDIINVLEGVGAQCYSAGHKEAIMVIGEAIRPCVPTVMEAIAETVLRPRPTEDDFALAQMHAQLELQNYRMEPEQWLQDVMHAVAFGPESPLGQELCNEEQIANITLDLVEEFRARYFVAKNMVFAGIGVEHDEFVQLVEKNFHDVSTADPVPTPAPPQYVGGIHAIPAGPNEPLLPGMEPASHCVLAFPTVGLVDADSKALSRKFYAVCILQSLLGGGASFSSGGPGKGMYSRLYTNVLNRFHFVQNVRAVNYAYEGVGLLGISGAVTPGSLPEMLNITCQMMASTAFDITEEAFTRARNQLKSTMFTNLESRLPAMEDIAHQVRVFGHYTPADEHLELMDSLTIDDVKETALEAMRSEPTVVLYGTDAVAHRGGDELFDSVRAYFRQVTSS